MNCNRGGPMPVPGRTCAAFGLSLPTSPRGWKPNAPPPRTPCGGMFVWKVRAVCHATPPKKPGHDSSPSQLDSPSLTPLQNVATRPSRVGARGVLGLDDGEFRCRAGRICVKERTTCRKTSGEGGRKGREEGAQSVREKLQGEAKTPLQAAANGPRKKPGRARRREHPNGASEPKSRKGECSKTHAEGATKSTPTPRRPDRFLVAAAADPQPVEKALIAAR